MEKKLFEKLDKYTDVDCYSPSFYKKTKYGFVVEKEEDFLNYEAEISDRQMESIIDDYINNVDNYGYDGMLEDFIVDEYYDWLDWHLADGYDSEAYNNYNPYDEDYDEGNI